MADPVISACTQVAVERVVNLIKTQLGYVWNYKTNIKNLEKQLGKLQGRKEMVQHLVDGAKRNGEEIGEQVVNWLDGVNKVIDEVTQFIDDNEKAEMKCFKSLCPNLKKRYQHSQNAAVKAKDVTELHDEGKFDIISYRTIPKETWHPSSKLYEDFASRMSTLTNVISALSSPNVNVVGFHGMGGIGKTTLAKEVGRQAEESKLFDSVLFVEISDQPDVMMVQGKIADMLSLTFDVTTPAGRASRLCERLKKERKVLLILDNIWESLDLEKVGIPLNDDHRGCKLLLTARDINVLLMMDCRSNFPIGILNEKEAWNLFEKIAGSCVQHHDLQLIAPDVAKRCGGLPIAIVTIAKALKNRKAPEWRNALLELQRPSSESQNASVTKEAYSCILLSYNHLESDELKSTFLLCCTMVLISNASLEELLRYGLGLNLFKRIKTVKEARDRVKTLIQKLKDSSLLLETPNDEHFSIHDVVRDVGKAIALSNHKNFIVDDIRALLNANTWENCTSIALLDIAELPKELDCPHLTFFYMKTKTEFSIPDNFFNGMRKLGVLHLEGMDLSELPASLSSLEKLRTLYLDSCNLGDIAIIGDLKNLEILVLFNSYSAKKLLSEAIGELNWLRLLDLRGSSFIFPPKTISRLTQLEELYMDDWYDQRQVEELDIETSVASLEELKDLPLLTALNISVKDAASLPKGLDFFQKLKRYNILIRDERDIRYRTSDFEFKRDIRETLRTLQVSSNTNLCLEDGVIRQLKGIECLLLDGEQRIMNVLCELDGVGFPKLTHFRISNNPFILCIVDSMLLATCVAFPLLETLSLSNLVRLEKICNDQLRIKCFCQLRTIKVHNCHKLKNLFSFSIAKHLSILQKIEVIDCRNMEEIFIVDKAYNGGIDSVFFEQLHSLTLELLPRFRRICSKIEVASTSQERWKPLTTNASSSEIVLKDQIDTLSLLDEKVVFPNLKHLNLHDINSKYMFSSSTLGSFNHLQSLDISGCKDLEELIRIDDKCHNYVEFPSLERLTINNCSELREFIFSEKVVFPNLKHLNLHDINLKYMFSSSTLGSFNHLQFLDISDCKDLEELIRIDDKCSNYVEFPSLERLNINKCSKLREFIFSEKVVFPNLKHLNLHDINLKYMFSSSTLGSFNHLQFLDISDCKDLEELIRIDDKCSNYVEFPSLERLNINNCSELREFIFGEKVSYPSLQEIRISNMANLRRIWQSQVIQSVEYYPKLDSVYVEQCLSLENIFSASVARGLLQLKLLLVQDCGIKEIVAKGVEEATVRFSFPQLTSLYLDSLKELSCFYPGKHTTEWPKLKELEVRCSEKIYLFSFQKHAIEGQLDEDHTMPQSLFSVDQEFLHLEKVTTNKNHLRMICQSSFSRVLFPKLKSLEVEGGESTIPPYSILEKFHNLEELQLDSSSYKEIFSCEEVEKHVGMFAQLKKLHLFQLFKLKQIWKQESKMDLIIQKLEFLQVSGCFNLINLMPPSAHFINLKILKVYGCHKLISLVPASVANSLMVLEEMSIGSCKKMTEIIENQGDVMEGEITLSKLKSLELYSLTNLTSFYSGNYTIIFPSLEKLTVDECPKLKFFSSGALSAPNLQEVSQDETDYKCEHPDLNTTFKQIRDKKVFSILEQSVLSSKDLIFVWNSFPEYTKVFSSTKRLKLSGNDIGMMWQSQFPEHIFPKLKCLDISNDTSIVFPFGSIFQRFHNLEKLQLRDCSYGEIFSYEEIEKYAWSPPQIKCLHLASLRDVRQMWRKDSKLNLLENLESLEVERCESLNNVLLPSSSFGNLKIMKVNNCKKLTSLMVASTTKSLLQLEEMQISGCEMITQVVANGGDIVEETITFCKLKKLELKDLSCFTRFSFGNYTFEIPILEKLTVKECPKMEIFTLRNLSTPMLREVWQDQTKYICKDDLNEIVRQHHEEMIFSRETLGFKNIKMALQKNPEHQKVFSNLATLTFTRDEIGVLWQSQFPQQLFPSLKFLRVFEDESTVFPLAILQRFRSVERLALLWSSYEEIFSCEDFEIYAGASAQIKRLGLYQLDNLKQMWKQDSSLDLILPNIEDLRVEWCGSLVTLVPPSSSFQNLTWLIVVGCDRLTNLLAPATAKSMVQLKGMQIRKCKTMTEVISSDEETVTDNEIIFNKLEWLELDGLSSLTSFCPGNHTFTFPYLSSISLKNCPKIKFFSSGVLNTPRLKGIWDGYRSYYCDDGLNATIQRIHEELTVKTSPEDCAGPSSLSSSAS